jgi:Ran GTPase-activating protein (RanGAP) involved in mRNA processing and transport
LRINDKGPTYLRGAIKAIEIFNLIELNLSDNLLEYEQAIMIAEMIALDTHLKVLNLSKNRFDEDCARVFARAIVFNKHLYEIDLSSNRLRDEGIAIFIYPFAYQALCKNIFEALLADPNTVRKPIRWLFNKGEVEI